MDNEPWALLVKLYIEVEIWALECYTFGENVYSSRNLSDGLFIFGLKVIGMYNLGKKAQRKIDDLWLM